MEISVGFLPRAERDHLFQPAAEAVDGAMLSSPEVAGFEQVPRVLRQAQRSHSSIDQ